MIITDNESFIPPFNAKSKEFYTPHLVILGAGASKQSFPHGDKNNRILPIQTEIMEIPGLKENIKKHFLNEISIAEVNIELFFDSIYKTGNSEGISIIENIIREYFEEMLICDEATIYDYLILSLRGKDVIASFNWDPLLSQAYRRVSKEIFNNLNAVYGSTIGIEQMKHIVPRLLFLHGNTGQGVCYKDKTEGFAGDKCGKCGNIYEKVKLLYPISQKNYSQNAFIESQWNLFTETLNEVFILTIFGYSAPNNDSKAIDSIRNAWKFNKYKESNEVEIIDIKGRDELRNVWKDFFLREHYKIHSDFKNSLMWYHPRRSCEAFGGAVLQNEPWKERPFKEESNLKELVGQIMSMINEEINISEVNPFSTS